MLFKMYLRRSWAKTACFKYINLVKPHPHVLMGIIKAAFELQIIVQDAAHIK